MNPILQDKLQELENAQDYFTVMYNLKGGIFSLLFCIIARSEVKRVLEV